MLNSKNKLIAASVLLAFALAGCASVKPGSQEAFDRDQQEKEKVQTKEVIKSIDEMPEWMSEPPKDSSNILYVAAVGDSARMQLAIDKAVQDAKHTLAERLQGIMSGQVKKMMDENGSGEITEDMKKTSISLALNVNLAGFTVQKQKVVPMGSKYRAYVLVSYPLGEANKILMDRIKGDAALKAKLAATESYQELEAKMAADSAKKAAPVK